MRLPVLSWRPLLTRESMGKSTTGSNPWEDASDTGDDEKGVVNVHTSDRPKSSSLSLTQWLQQLQYACIAPSKQNT